MDGDQMLRFDDIRRPRRLFGTHVVDSIDRKEGVVDVLRSQSRHVIGRAGVARQIEKDPIDVDEIADAFFFVVVVVISGNGLDMDPKVIKLTINPAGESVRRPDNDRPRGLMNEIDPVMVVMLMMSVIPQAV